MGAPRALVHSTGWSSGCDHVTRKRTLPGGAASAPATRRARARSRSDLVLALGPARLVRAPTPGTRSPMALAALDTGLVPSGEPADAAFSAQLTASSMRPMPCAADASSSGTEGSSGVSCARVSYWRKASSYQPWARSRSPRRRRATGSSGANSTSSPKVRRASSASRSARWSPTLRCDRRR